MRKGLLKLSGMLKSILTVYGVLTLSALQLRGQKNTREQYIEKYSLSSQVCWPQRRSLPGRDTGSTGKIVAATGKTEQAVLLR